MTFFNPGKYNIFTLNSEIMPNGAVVWVKRGLRHEKWQWQVVCDLSKVEMLDLLKNGGNVWWLHGQLIVNDQKWNNRIPCLWVCERKNQVVANGLLIFVAWPYDMGTGGISGQRKFSIWGRMLEGYHRRQETFFILECLLCGNGPLQCFGPTLQEIS
jgi:hypothetical protein